MKTYAVKKGEHDFKPNDQPAITWKSKCDWEFQLSESMYYTRKDEDYPHGTYNGWNKLGLGVTWFFSKNNNRSAMIGWFPDEKQLNRFNLVGYVNDKNGDWKAETLLNVGLSTYEGQTIWSGDQVVFKIREKGSTDDYKFLTMPLKRARWARIYRGLGAWFGGQFPAHKDMTFSASVKY